MFYHAYVDGYTKQAKTINEVQTWLDGLRNSVAGKTLKVWRVIDNVAEYEPCICGPVTKG